MFHTVRSDPLTSGKIAEANIIIEQMKEQGSTPEENNEALTRQGLPSLVEIGKSTLLQPLEAQSPQVKGGSRH